MKKRVALSALVLMVMVVCSSVAFALAPMGPPRANLHEGQGALGLEYGFGEMDLQTFGSVTEKQYISGVLQTTAISYTSFDIKDLQTSMIWGRLDVGTWENWDMFVRLGMTDAQDDISSVNADGSLSDQYKEFDGDYGFGWGFGTRATFYQEGDTTWGGLIQVTWSNPDSSEIILQGESTFTGEVEIDYWEVQIAIGPTVETDSFRLYGGPFLNFINGNLDLKGSYDPTGVIDLITQETEHDIREESQVGGYAGAQWYLDENSSIFTELLFTSDAWGVGIGSTWKF